jgi:hypothetical protein
MIDARKELRDALAQRATAESALEQARQASARGRALIEAVTRQIEDSEAASIRASSLLAANMKAAVASGRTPSVAGNNHEPAKNVASRSELDIRRQAAEQVVAELAAEEHEREGELSDATAAVGLAVQTILRFEVEKITARWVEVDREARALRIRLGREGDPVWRLAGQSDVGCRATGQNFYDAEFDFRQQQAASTPWIEFCSALISDPNATLDFSAADRAIEEMSNEHAERRAADERFIERMRGEAA